MSLNLINAFTFVFKQKNWFVKILIGSILFFFIKVIALSTDIMHSEALPRLSTKLVLDGGIASTLILMLIYLGAIALIILSVWMHATSFGYIVTTIRRYMRNEEDAVPDWDAVMGKLFKRGFKAFLAFFILTSVLTIFAGGAYMMTAFWLMFSPFASMLTGLIALFIVVYATIMMPALLMSFCERDRFIAAFDFVRARQLALKSIWKYALMLIMLFVIDIVILASIILLFHTKVGIIILPITTFYLFIVFGNVIAQYYVAYCKE